MNEFSLIDRFFKSIPIQNKDVLIGIGDDAACIDVPQGMNLLVSTDTLVSGVHFLPHWSAYDIASKALRVNLSDMAAMAAVPRWLTLALTLPELDTDWLDAYAKGLRDTLHQFNVDLIGGDTTRGPLSMTLTIMGLAPSGQSVMRSSAKAGDVILVSGPLGAAALAVKLIEKLTPKDEGFSELMNALHHPNPRVDLMSFLRDYASAAIDISDGLAADLNHICSASQVGARLIEETIPIHPLLQHYWTQDTLNLALTGGDDYELCFTVPKARFDSCMSALKKANLICYPIGFIEESSGLTLTRTGGQTEAINPCGYLHFG